VSDPRSSGDRPLPERLALGEASRMLGVDPDTLRRWADEGRVPAFTTPGGHRRFERRALERLIAAGAPVRPAALPASARARTA
jgi:excisionase family DNA binding protein